MDRIHLLFTSLSLVFVTICFVASTYMAISLPAGHEDRMFFAVIAGVFLIAVIWFGYNVLSLTKKK